jgi:hypothetical protein
MKKLANLSIRIPPETKDAIEAAAKADMRSMASLMEKILSDWLREHGWLKDTKHDQI